MTFLSILFCMNRDNNLWTVVASLQAFFRSLHVCIIGLEPCKTRSGVFRTSRLKIHKIHSRCFEDSSQDLDKKIPRRYDYEQLRTLVLVQYDSKIQERNLLQSSKSHKSTQRPLKYNVLIISYYKAYKYSTPLIIVPDLVRQQ